MLYPPSLRPDSLILVVSPSYLPEIREMEAGMESFRRMGFRIEAGPNSAKTWGKFAGSDEERLHDLQWALDHPDADMIICSRGGYGAGRLVRDLDFSGFLKKPKWLTGFSDITLLHLQIQELGYASMHGPMVVHHARLPHLPACMKQNDFLTRKSSLSYLVNNPFPEMQTNGINGIVAGGNLSLLSYIIHELDEHFFENRIVFIEEVGETYHKIDRMLDMLVRTGKFEKAAGFVLGSFSDCEEDGFPMKPFDMLREKIHPDQPVFSDLPCGHKSPSFPLVLGYPASISAEGASWVFKQANLPLTS
jgi:muramoyltetrapeptide carboxypeptidase